MRPGGRGSIAIGKGKKQQSKVKQSRVKQIYAEQSRRLRFDNTNSATQGKNFLCLGKWKS